MPPVLQDPNETVELVKDTEASMLRGHAALFDRFKVNTDILWRIIGFVLAIEATLFVGMTKVSAAQQFFIGLALLTLGIVGPLSIRFVESILMADRLLLDNYERELLTPPYRQNHGKRMRDRLTDIRQFLDEEQLQVLDKRQMKGRYGPVLNKLLDLAGQPTIVWTSVISLAGAIGFGFGFTALIHSLRLQIPIITIASTSIASLWLVANQAHELAWRLAKRVSQVAVQSLRHPIKSGKNLFAIINRKARRNRELIIQLEEDQISHD